MHDMTPVSEEKLTPAEGGELIVYAKDQPQYIPLPVYRFKDGMLYSEWELNVDDIMEAALQGKKLRVRLWQWTFNQPLQPVRLELVEG